jgi:plastocyanin
MNAKTLAVLAAVAAVGGGAIPATAGGLAFDQGAHAAGSHTVVLQHNQFRPGSVSIRRGESVTWAWRDGHVVHNVIASSFRSRIMSHGTFTVRFTRSGTYNYRCTVHPHMAGSVIVH